MGTVTIAGNQYSIYGSLSGADAYLAAKIGAGAWASATNDTKGQCLVTASRLIQNYLVGKGYDIEPEESASKALAQADYELAYALLVDPSLADQSASASGNKKRVKAGSAEVEYFAPQSTIGITANNQFPATVMALLKKWISIQGGGAGSGIGIPFSSGTCERSTLVRSEADIQGAGDCGCNDRLPYPSNGGPPLDIDDEDDDDGGVVVGITADSTTATADSDELTADMGEGGGGGAGGDSADTVSSFADSTTITADAA